MDDDLGQNHAARAVVGPVCTGDGVAYRLRADDYRWEDAALEVSAYLPLDIMPRWFTHRKRAEKANMTTILDLRGICSGQTRTSAATMLADSSIACEMAIPSHILYCGQDADQQQQVLERDPNQRTELKQPWPCPCRHGCGRSH